MGELAAVFYYSGNSMAPTFVAGDFIRVESVGELSELQVGDVVVIKPVFSSAKSNKHVVHRIAEITEEGKIKTKGDNNSQLDSWELEVSDLVGKVANAVRPDRIKKYILHNQHSKKSREFAASVIAKNEREYQQVVQQLKTAMEDMENSKEYQDYLNSESNERFSQAIIDYNEETITEEEFRAIMEEFQASEEYKNHFDSSSYKEYIRLLKIEESFEPIKILTDSSSVRKKFNISAFPTSVMEIPEYIKDTGEIVNKDKKYLRKVTEVNSLESWEALHVNNIKTFIDVERVVSIEAQKKRR